MEPLIPAMLLTPTAVLLASLAGRRWGPIVGGRLAALPLTSGPLVLIAATMHGAGAGRALAEGILAGMPTVVVFCAGYRFAATRHSWRFCLPVTVTATVLTGGLLSLLPLPAWTSVAVVAAAGLRRMPVSDHRWATPAWELPVRMAVTTAVVLTLGVLSSTVDSRIAGVLATFPALACVLAVLAHRRHGAGAAIELVRGVLRGLPPTAVFFLALTVAL